MILETKGIVFRALKYSETSIIADIFTSDLGLKSYIISGVRTKSAKTKAALLQLMSIVDLVVYDNPKKDLNRIKEIKSGYVYSELPYRIHKSSLGLFMVEICKNTITEAEKNLDLYLFLEAWFIFLDKTEQSVSNLHLLFLVELSEFLGFRPMGNFDPEKQSIFNVQEGIFETTFDPLADYFSQEHSVLLSIFLEGNRNTIHETKLSKENRNLFLAALLKFYQYHVNGFKVPNSHEILQQVFS